MVFEFIAKHQLNAMLVLSGICAVLAIFVLFIKTISAHRKAILIIMDISAGLLLVFDRYAYIFRGDVSELGFVMVRVSNFLVFFLTLFCILMFNSFLADLYSKDVKLGKAPIPLQIVKALTLLGMLLLAISQFTGLYYTFDEFNQYQRSSTFWLCYLIPLLSLVIQFSVIIAYRKRIKRSVMLFLAIFTLVPLAASLVQFATRGISFTNIALATVVILLFLFTLIDVSNDAVKANDLEIEYLKKEQKDIQLLLEQTTEALATAIDVKDPYTHGHSTRVAEYSRKIAEQAGKSTEECDEIYFAAILHDVGKILVPTDIINKDGKLTKEEFEEIKKHPVHGNQILSRISKSPYLSIGAHFHHERYDGKGYPDGLKGEDIPEIARIIAVADAYDAMTSKRSYRDPIPQDKVREEFVKGIGTQFDPKFAKLMIHLIDLDAEYEMKEREEITELSGKHKFECEALRDNISEGIPITPFMTRLSFHATTDKDHEKKECIPSMIIFDALDGRTHEEDNMKKEMLYFEYGTIRIDGETSISGARKIEKKVIVNEGEKKNDKSLIDPKGVDYVIEACKMKDHLLFRIKNKFETTEIIMALPDSVRYAYIGLTGEHCTMTNISMEKEEKEIDENYIPRIAEEISFVKDEPVGIVPNVQIDGWCYTASHGIEIKDGMKLSFHTMSLPTARLIWHCPYIELFYADDKLVNGKNFYQFALVRLDGEAWEMHDGVESKTSVNKDDTFEGWDYWKENNSKGFDVTVTFKRNKNKITIITENFGISIHSVVTIIEDVPDVYAALTGDQVAISNIRIVE